MSFRFSNRALIDDIERLVHPGHPNEVFLLALDTKRNTRTSMDQITSMEGTTITCWLNSDWLSMCCLCSYHGIVGRIPHGSRVADKILDCSARNEYFEDETHFYVSIPSTRSLDIAYDLTIAG